MPSRSSSSQLRRGCDEMNCFPCFSFSRSKKDMDASSDSNPNSNDVSTRFENKSIKVDPKDIKGQNFNFRELATATRNFRQECMLGEGGFGRVYKGTLKASGQVVAVKQLDRHGMQENNEFLAEILALSKLHHPNLVKFIGYCADGDQRLLVYEFVSAGSVEDHLSDKSKEKEPIDWTTRMKIAYGAAQALEYLHTAPQPPIVYRDLKASSILLDDEFNPKLSDIGLDKLGLFKSKMPAQSRMMATYGYSAPEYTKGGQLTVKSDVYSFGVIFLELITGRRGLDTTKPNDEQNLVTWAQPIFRDPKRYPDMADPRLNKKFPEKDLNQAVAIASMCLQEEDGARPLMSDVVTALSFLSMAVDVMIPPAPVPSFSLKDEAGGYSSHSSNRTSHSSNEGKVQRSKKPHFSLSLKGRRRAISLALKGNKRSDEDRASGSSNCSEVSEDEMRHSISSSDSSVSRLSRKSSSMLHRQATSNHCMNRQSTSTSYASDQYESEED